MPKIPDEFIRTCVFMYPTKDDAENGTNRGGTGFFVAIPTPDPSKSHCYIVSNWHVVMQRGNSCFAIARNDGGVDAYDFGPEEWEYDASLGYDICVRSLPGVDLSIHEMTFVPIGAFLSEKGANAIKIGPGDDVFMMGLFVSHTAADGATPAARFGHISMNPAPVPLETGKSIDCYCVDTNSRTGFSGSPVFVYRTAGNDISVEQPRQLTLDTPIALHGRTHLSLLGIHVGQFPEHWEVKGGSLTPGAEASGDVLSHYVKGLSGMTVVIPAWKILEVLNMKKLADRRSELDRKISSKMPVRPEPEVVPDNTRRGDAVLGKMLDTPPKPHNAGD